VGVVAEWSVDEDESARLLDGEGVGAELLA
jgi:hypothetical protein